jgi:hypothetical protein
VLAIGKAANLGPLVAEQGGDLRSFTADLNTKVLHEARTHLRIYDHASGFALVAQVVAGHSGYSSPFSRFVFHHHVSILKSLCFPFFVRKAGLERK